MPPAQHIIQDPSTDKTQIKNIGKFVYECLSDNNTPKIILNNNKHQQQNKEKDLLFKAKYCDGSDCAIRRYSTYDGDGIITNRVQHEMDIQVLETIRINDHENFVRYLGLVEETIDKQFSYAVEFCRYSVEMLIRTPTQPTTADDTELNVQVRNVWKNLTKENILYQTTLALEHLHSLGYIHRNIHARNVLVAEITNGNNNAHYIVKLSDFRFCQKVEKQTQNALMIQSPSSCIAPEMKGQQEVQVGPWTDVFILGCFFYYVLSGGEHLFGQNETDIETNICKIQNERHLKLVQCMTSNHPTRRPSIFQIRRYLISNSSADVHQKSCSSTSSSGGHLRPGLCVIFHQETSNQKLENLPGYREDVKSLCIKFWQFDYDIRIYVDLTGEELLQTAKQLAEEKDAKTNHSIFNNYASLVVCILSHGGADGKSVNLNKLQLTFGVEQCPDLQGKPKIFIVQTGHHETHTETNTTDASTTESADPRISSSSIRLCISDAILLLGNSFVYPQYGSIFVQSLCYHLQYDANRVKIEGRRDLYQAYLDVIQEIASKMNDGANETPLYLSTMSSSLLVEFQIVPLEKRHNNSIHYYVNELNNSDSSNSYRDLNKFLLDKLQFINLEKKIQLIFHSQHRLEDNDCINAAEMRNVLPSNAEKNVNDTNCQDSRQTSSALMQAIMLQICIVGHWILKIGYEFGINRRGANGAMKTQKKNTHLDEKIVFSFILLIIFYRFF